MIPPADFEKQVQDEEGLVVVTRAGPLMSLETTYMYFYINLLHSIPLPLPLSMAFSSIDGHWRNN